MIKTIKKSTDTKKKKKKIDTNCSKSYNFMKPHLETFLKIKMDS